MAWTQSAVNGLTGLRIHARIEFPNEMNVGQTDAEFIQKISKSFMKGGDEKEVNYVGPVDWINPKTKHRMVIS